MKIQIRKGVFETNSSSTHSVIISNSANVDKIIKEVTDNVSEYWIDYFTMHDKLTSVEEKVLFLGGLFDLEICRFKSMFTEYKVFRKILTDMSEDDLIKRLDENSSKYTGLYDEPYCSDYYENGCMIDCNCGFHKLFNEYFGDDLSEEQLYQKLKDFIYKDGVIVPYEEI